MFSSSNIAMDDSSNDDEFGDESSVASGGKSEESWIDGVPIRMATTYEENEFAAEARLKALYPYCDLKKTPLPREWNKCDKHFALNVSHMGLRVSYSENVKKPNEASQIRANFPIPPHCGIYYFEVNVIKGPYACMGVGICEKIVGTQRLPGWDRFSYGYHGDDGHFFSHSADGNEYGPKFGTGDVIGCGLNLVEKSVFFTKNGENLGVACDVERVDALYPTVGLQAAGEIIDVNFGQKPFVYNIQKDLLALREKVKNDILKLELPPEKTQWMNKAVCSWLMSEGHSKSLTAFCKAAKLPIEHSEELINKRNAIRNLISSRQTNDAVRKIDEYYPNLLDTNKKVSLILKCQQFVEMTLQLAIQLSPTTVMNGSLGQYSGQSGGMLSTAGTSRAPKRRPTHDLSESPSSSSGRLVDVDGPPVRRSPRERSESLEMGSRNGSCKNGSSKNGADTTTTTIENEETTDGVVVDEDGSLVDMSRAGYTEAQKQEYEPFRPALDFGGSIHRLLNELEDSSGELKELVNSALATLCITDSAVLCIHRLLSDVYVESVAETVNSAILAFEGRESSPVLCKYLSTAFAMKKEMMDEGIPAAQFANIDELVFGKEENERVNQIETVSNSVDILHDDVVMEPI